VRLNLSLVYKHEFLCNVLENWAEVQYIGFLADLEGCIPIPIPVILVFDRICILFGVLLINNNIIGFRSDVLTNENIGCVGQFHDFESKLIFVVDPVVIEILVRPLVVVVGQTHGVEFIELFVGMLVVHTALL